MATQADVEAAGKAAMEAQASMTILQFKVQTMQAVINANTSLLDKMARTQEKVNDIR